MCGVCICVTVCVYRQHPIQRVIILNGEIKGLHTSSVIQLSISQLISKQRGGGGGGWIGEGERDVPGNSSRDSVYKKGRIIFCSLILITFIYWNRGMNLTLAAEIIFQLNNY